MTIDWDHVHQVGRLNPLPPAATWAVLGVVGAYLVVGAVLAGCTFVMAAVEYAWAAFVPSYRPELRKLRTQVGMQGGWTSVYATMILRWPKVLFDRRYRQKDPHRGDDDA